MRIRDRENLSQFLVELLMRMCIEELLVRMCIRSGGIEKAGRDRRVVGRYRITFAGILRVWHPLMG